ncbi:hypothetical protein NIES4071_60450 [Calothrix sp. NIES-4071]|nr:hypothetical protein NIES4071_60450 [Calothrix sp. NIES-4071]BAZ60352.1 hypothetical protein NIES4105_60400 [Calothrix sp. NIES-4105]
MTSSRYQSRLFNFFSRQSQRFGDSVGRTWRSCRVAANWSLEALVYPIFLLIQKTVNSADKQLRPSSAPQQHLNSDGNLILDNSTPECDTAIVHMLEIVKKLPSRHENSLNPVAEKLDYVRYHQQLEIDDTVKAYLPTVRGIATQLGNKHIVLVTTDNKVLDILTLKQQQKLQDRIIAEMSEYWRLWHLSSKQVESKNLLPEIELLLYKLTGGNTTPEASEAPSSEEINTLSSAQAYLSGLDALIARLESIVSTVRTTNQINQYNIQNHTPQNTTSPITHVRTVMSAAINRLFNKFTINQYREVVNKQGQIKATATLPKLRQSTNETEDLWLTFDDLFGEELQAPGNHSSVTNHYPRLLNPYKAKEQPAGKQKISQTISLGIERHIPRVSSLSKESIMSKLFDSTGTIAQNPKKSAVSQDESSIVISNRADSVTIKQGHQAQAEDKPEFVEILATNVGYEKHILERILEWLDNLMLWLEDQFVRILKLIQQIFA